MSASVVSKGREEIRSTYAALGFGGLLDVDAGFEEVEVAPLSSASLAI